MHTVRALATAALVLAVPACGGPADDDDAGPGPGRAGDRLAVATTVAPVTSIVATIAGERADVTGIVAEGTDSHTFEPRPSVAELLSKVDVVYLNGLQLEEPTRELAEANLAEGSAIVALGELALPEQDYIYDFSFPEEAGRPNPHLWTDPDLALEYAEIVAGDLAGRDPGNAEYYRRNLDAFAVVVAELSSAMREAFATIPDGQRQLLTYHDAYAYVAPNYGFEVIGAIQVSDFEDPTPREVAGLIDQVRDTGIRAIFGSEVFPSPVLEQIGRETGVRYVDTLRDDDLPGEPGEAEHSWAGLMRRNYVTITEALGGDAAVLEALEIAPVAPDQAEYPQ
ncbi:MAG TPA: metal ABC transporter substrate-binding protein [Acidimicrobiales bacterium]|jgi:ABC-type Zn uptake system ZnuABC Zn-binding protein ZnuA|nr:metal ABC transporter substrate-binding protein [Acidimicrobiales bacterium]